MRINWVPEGKTLFFINHVLFPNKSSKAVAAVPVFNPRPLSKETSLLFSRDETAFKYPASAVYDKVKVKSLLLIKFFKLLLWVLLYDPRYSTKKKMQLIKNLKCFFVEYQNKMAVLLMEHGRLWRVLKRFAVMAELLFSLLTAGYWHVSLHLELCYRPPGRLLSLYAMCWV